MSTLGQRIKAVRKQNSVTQQEFSQRICVSQSYLSRLEADKEIPTEMLLKLIALEFGISLEWLEKGKGAMLIQEGSDYFERNQPNIIGSVEDNFRRIVPLINNSRSEYLEMSVSSILQQIEAIICMFPEDAKRSDILIESMASWCIGYVEFLEYAKKLDSNSTDGIRELYASFFRFEEDTASKMQDILKNCEKTVLQQ